MISDEELQEILPFPIKIIFYGEDEDCDLFRKVTRDSFKKLTEKHNKKYKEDTRMEEIARHYTDFTGGNAFEVYVGNEIVHKGSAPEQLEEDKLIEYFLSIVDITEKILDTWHDEIIKVQEENKIKLHELEAEEYYEMLYAYYSLRHDSKSFLYVKKLAERYPNSRYKNILRRIYKDGLYGHKRSVPMRNKLSRREKGIDEF